MPSSGASAESSLISFELRASCFAATRPARALKLLTNERRSQVVLYLPHPQLDRQARRPAKVPALNVLWEAHSALSLKSINHIEIVVAFAYSSCHFPIGSSAGIERSAMCSEYRKHRSVRIREGCWLPSDKSPLPNFSKANLRHAPLLHYLQYRQSQRAARFGIEDRSKPFPSIRSHQLCALDCRPSIVGAHHLCASSTVQEVNWSCVTSRRRVEEETIHPLSQPSTIFRQRDLLAVYSTSKKGSSAEGRKNRLS